jgi:hypothetical protein
MNPADIQKALDEGRALLHRMQRHKGVAAVRVIEVVEGLVAALESVQTAQPGSERIVEIKARILRAFEVNTTYAPFARELDAIFAALSTDSAPQNTAQPTEREP